MGEEISVELDTTYPACIDKTDEKRRAFVFECLANADIDGRILLKNCALAEEWIKSGTLPADEKPRLR